MRECVSAEALVAVDPKMEREEISTSVVGLEFSIEFRQLLAHSKDIRSSSLLRHALMVGVEGLGRRARAGRPHRAQGSPRSNSFGPAF
jgi:hypothetical protein